MHRATAIKILAEFIGTATLLMIIVGSGIMADQLFTPSSQDLNHNVGFKLLANSLATGAGIFVLIQSLAPISGAHFNPLVTVFAVYQRKLNFRLSIAYIAAQFFGAILGVIVTHLMFARPLLEVASQPRASLGLWISESVATAALLAIISLNAARPLASQAANIGLWIMAAYWFTSSTSFANPAVTLARSLTASFSGIARSDVLGFCLAQVFGLGLVVAASPRGRVADSETIALLRS